LTVRCREACFAAVLDEKGEWLQCQKMVSPADLKAGKSLPPKRLSHGTGKDSGRILGRTS
jgi:hypothetical protein